MSNYKRDFIGSGSPITAKDLPKASVPTRTSLERKLELLEERFIRPFDQFGSPSTATSSPSESATLGSFSSPQAPTTGSRNAGAQHQNQASNLSQHSFSFDAPCRSLHSEKSYLSSSSHHNTHKTNSYLGTSRVRFNTKPESASGVGDFSNHSSLNNNLVEEVTSRHMEKVAQKLSMTKENSSHTDALLQSQNSNPTVITSHVNKSGNVKHPDSSKITSRTIASTIVQETPPDNSLSLHRKFKNDKDSIKSFPNPDVSNFDVISNRNSENCFSQTSRDKRKSVPVKREMPSVKDTVGSKQKNTEHPPIHSRTSCFSSSEKRNVSDRKRKRLDFDPPSTTNSANLITSPPNQPKSGNRHDDSEDVANNISPAVRRKKTTSPLRSRGSPFSSFRLPSEHSRDNSRPFTKSSNRTKLPAPSNNTTIYDFFPSAAKKDTAVNAVSSKVAESKKIVAQSPHKKAKARVSLEALSDFGSLKTAELNKELQMQLKEVEEWKQRCQELERSCEDKDEQLKAVSNNRTILHSALKSSLQQREGELEKLKNEKESYERSSRHVLEKLVRKEACQQARELREKLAVDGARLGRIVYTRAGGMIGRSAHIETWEDGHATKELSAKRAELSIKRKKLERRQEAAKLAYERLKIAGQKTSKENECHQAVVNENGSHVAEENEEVGGIVIRTSMDAKEAVESVRLHLSNIRRQEKEVALEEQNLNDEKGQHIRALKRVASEDASRFRSRPKLNDRYVLQELLGKGGFSEVWRAYDLIDLKEVAVKIHQLDPRWPDSKKENYTKHVSREYEIHRNVRHPRIVSLYDVFEIDNNSFATVLECCNGTDLDTLLKTRRRLSERDARAILLQILSGMRYLSHPPSDSQRQGIIHYDLKPGNILFDEYGDAKITDFGLSKIVDAPDAAESMELTSQGAGTYWYLPPECFVVEDSIRISNKVDVWSIGVIFYQMLFGKRPFGDGQSQDRILSDRTMLNAHEVKFPDKPEVSKECKQFIRACLTYDQTFRPTIGQLCENSYIVSKSL